jgi:hypothetical protein
MNKRRLRAIETATAKLPPNGAALLREMERIKPGPMMSAWLKARTDEELEALIEVKNGDDIYWELVTDAELEQMCAGTFDFANIRTELIKQ